MIEPIMFFGLGFLAASLVALVVVPLVHARAVRLTRRRLSASGPNSLAEIQADKDQLRAEFAMSTRRLEMSMEQLRAKTTDQLADLGRKTAAVNALKAELAEKTAALSALEAREKALREQLGGVQQDAASKAGSLQETERKLTEKDAELVKIAADLEQRSVTADSQRIEIVALKTQIATLRDQLSDFEVGAKSAEARMGRERDNAEKAARALEQERARVAELNERLAELERHFAAQAAEAEMLKRRTIEVEPLLAEREQQVNEAVGERDRLRSELAALRREAETSWEAERMENALLRERINDVAAEVARLTSALEGPDSAIDAILAADPPRVSNGGRSPGRPVSLADRIRALQSRAAHERAAN